MREKYGRSPFTCLQVVGDCSAASAHRAIYCHTMQQRYEELPHEVHVGSTTYRELKRQDSGEAHLARKQGRR